VASQLLLLPHSAKSYPAHRIGTSSTSTLSRALGHLKKISHTLNALSRLQSSHASPSNSVSTCDFFCTISVAPASFLAPPHHCRLLWPAPHKRAAVATVPPHLKLWPLPPLCSNDSVHEMSRLISELFSLLLLQVWCSIYR
jgi:hypothetical protein